MDINEMKRKEFEVLPHRKWDEPIEFDSLIILPGLAKDKHDSGYRCLDFVAVTEGVPQCLLSGCSDVINFDGIGGWGKIGWKNTSIFLLLFHPQDGLSTASPKVVCYVYGLHQGK